MDPSPMKGGEAELYPLATALDAPAPQAPIEHSPASTERRIGLIDRLCRLNERLGKAWPWFGAIVHWLGVSLGILAIAWFCRHVIPFRMDFIREGDSEAYFLIGKAFSEFSWPVWADEIGRFEGHRWIDAGEDRVAAKYAPGWPILLTIGYWVGGAEGALWVNPILMVIVLAVFFLLATELFNSTAGFIATTVLMLSPMFAFYMLYPLTHTADVAATLLGFWLTLRWARSRRRLALLWSAAAGLCIGFMPLIRPTAVLVWPALLGFCLVMRRGTKRPPAEAGGFEEQLKVDCCG